MSGLDTINSNSSATARGHQETSPLLISTLPQTRDNAPKYRSNSFDQNHGRAYSDAVVHHAKKDIADETDRDVSYCCLFFRNDNFRWYLSSYLVTCAGEWFTYVASISAIEQIHASNNTVSRTSISILVSLRLLPNALFTSIGGVLADSYDRRTILWVLDLLGSMVALLFLLAYHLKSITALYMASALQMTVAAIYEPSRTALVSMLVTEEESLKYAITMSELAWSVMTALGSSMGGFAAEWFGVSTCFVIDSISYLISALFIWNIRGTYYATSSKSESTSVNSNGNKEEETFFFMFVEGLKYLFSKQWGPFVLLKFCAALIYGAGDVLNVSYSERVYADSLERSNQRLGVLFAFVGIGCFCGPVIVDRFTSMDQVASLERACLGSFLLMGLGCFGIQCEEFPLGVHLHLC